LDKEKAERNLKEILEKMNNSADIAQLHEYYKLYKKEVSFFKRSWAAAWLFMYYDSKENPRVLKTQGKTKPVNEKKGVFTAQEKPAQEKSKEGNASERVPVEINMSEEESKRLFISIGKNRRLFPREIITLIMSKTSAAREDIGMIRILDNYSFVQVRDIKAEEIINTLTGIRFRGRTLTVNFAKPKSTEPDNEN